MRLAAAILATALPCTAMADQTYWDSVLARGIIDGVQPCEIARQDADAGQAPYLERDSEPDVVKRAMAAQMLCLHHLGAWGLDPVSAARAVVDEATEGS